MKRWLSLKEAMEYCPYGEKKLIELIKEGEIDGGQSQHKKNAWFIDRKSIDKHFEGMYKNTQVRIDKLKIVEFCQKGV